MKRTVLPSANSDNFSKKTGNKFYQQKNKKGTRSRALLASQLPVNLFAFFFKKSILALPSVPKKWVNLSLNVRNCENESLGCSSQKAARGGGLIKRRRQAKDSFSPFMPHASPCSVKNRRFGGWRNLSFCWWDEILLAGALRSRERSFIK